MPRHRGKFDVNRIEPYELSRSRIENFIKCPACFYMQQVEKIDFPSIPGFNINEATDILLKKDFDYYRRQQKPHPFLVKNGLSNLIPYRHENFELWTQSLHFGAENRFHYDDQENNLRVGGGLDDVWLNTISNKLHIVDYKSTSQKKDSGPITLNDEWKGSYKRQMDFYIWIMKKKGFNVDDVGFITSLASYLQSTYQLSTVNTFFTGMSNGGELCYVLACEVPNVFRAFAPVAGTIFPNGLTNNICSPTVPVPIFETHGRNDNVTLIEGDPLDQYWGPYLGIDTIISFCLLYTSPSPRD